MNGENVFSVRYCENQLGNIGSVASLSANRAPSCCQR